MNGSNNSVDTAERELDKKRGEFPPPIAKLIGFKLASAGSGRATIELKQTIGTRIRWDTSWRRAVRYRGRLDGHCLQYDPRSGRDVHHRRVAHQFFTRFGMQSFAPRQGLFVPARWLASSNAMYLTNSGVWSHEPPAPA
jgi:hypothetical protein